MRAIVTIEIRGSGVVGEDTIRVEVVEDDFHPESKSADFLIKAVRRAHERADTALNHAMSPQW